VKTDFSWYARRSSPLFSWMRLSGAGRTGGLLPVGKQARPGWRREPVPDPVVSADREDRLAPELAARKGRSYRKTGANKPLLVTPGGIAAVLLQRLPSPRRTRAVSFAAVGTTG
jgi:hypothetical protein